MTPWEPFVSVTEIYLKWLRKAASSLFSVPDEGPNTMLSSGYNFPRTSHVLWASPSPFLQWWMFPPHLPLFACRSLGSLSWQRGLPSLIGTWSLHCVCLQIARVFHHWNWLLSAGFVFLTKVHFQANTATCLIDGEPYFQRITAATPLFGPFWRRQAV